MSGSNGAERLRAGVDRLHAAQLAALAGRLGGARDAWSVLAGLLEAVGRIGAALMGLPRVAAGGEAEARREVVRLAVDAANLLAELTGLCFELEGGRGTVGDPAAGLVPAPAARAPATLGQTEVMTVRALTDLNRLLIEQLQRLFETLRQKEGWSPAPPGALWLEIVRGAAALAPLGAALELGPLAEAETLELRRVTAELGNAIAFLRSYPRFPRC